jgi:hypothetical protein
VPITAACSLATWQKENYIYTAAPGTMASAISRRDPQKARPTLLESISPDVIRAEIDASWHRPRTHRGADSGCRRRAEGPRLQTARRCQPAKPHQITSAGYDLQQAEKRTTSFREFIEKHKDELLALHILYSQPYPSVGSHTTASGNWPPGSRTRPTTSPRLTYGRHTSGLRRRSCAVHPAIRC